MKWEGASTAERLVDVCNDALTIAALEIVEQPELMRYCSSAKAKAERDRARAQHTYDTVVRVLDASVKHNAKRGDIEWCVLVRKMLLTPTPRELMAKVFAIASVMERRPFVSVGIH